MGQSTAIWPVPPLMAGAWRDLDPPLAGELGERLVKLQWRRIDFAGVGPMRRFRVFPLTCYPDWLSVEALAPGGGMADAVVWMLYGPLGAVSIDGGSEILHELNDTGALAIATPEAAAEYVRLFTSAVHGDEGPFAIIENRERLAELTGSALDDGSPIHDLTRSVPEDGPPIRKKLRPVEISPREGDGWDAKACVLYGDALFDATFALTPNGMIEMIDDVPLMQLAAPLACAFDGFLRRALPAAKGK